MIGSIMVAVLLSVSAPEPPAFFAGNEELSAYLLEAGKNSPELHARYAEWRAALERISQVGGLEDPQFTYGQFLQSDTLRAKAGLSQRFPWFGTRKARRQREAAEAEAALQAFYAARNRIFLEVKRVYFERALLEERIRITKAQLAVIEQFRGLVEAKLALGLASEDELLRVGIEQTQLQERRDELVARRPFLLAELNRAMGAAVDMSRPAPQNATLPPAPPGIEEVRARVREANPEVAVWEALRAAREEAVDVAKREGRPSIRLGLEYTSVSAPRQIRPDRPYPASLNAANRLLGTLSGTNPFTAANVAIDAYALATAGEPMSYRGGGEDNVMLSVGMNLPVWRKRVKASVEEARLLAKAAEYEERREVLRLDTAAQRALYLLEDAQRRYGTYRDSLLPQALQTYESLTHRYAAGLEGMGFLDLLEVLQQMLAFQLEQARAERDWQAAAAELEYLLGGRW